MDKKLNVLLVGGGGREHAIAWKLNQSPRLGTLFIAPGNGGTGMTGVNVPIKATDISGLLKFALDYKIDLTIVSQDDPLAMGIVDVFTEHGLAIFGPTKAAAQIEASKAWAKNLMADADVPTAQFVTLNDYPMALELVRDHFYHHEGDNSKPIVVKASGLALGKGAYVCKTLVEAEQVLDDIMVKRIHGDAGNEVVIEDYLDGQEVSLHAICGHSSFSMFPSAQDHKAAYDGDMGPNTGGMGAFAPVPWFTSANMDFVERHVVGPILSAMDIEGAPFMGFLYPGMKMSRHGPRVLEFNARPGDPEMQVYMRLLKTDLLEIILFCMDGKLDEVKVEWNPGYAVCVVLASGGYPSPDYKKGMPITGIEDAELLSDVLVFHAGTTNQDGLLKTSGGRILGVTAIGSTLQEAIDRAYAGVAHIHFNGMQYRNDIGAKGLQTL